MRPSAAQDVAAPLTRALTLFRHELFTAMITVVNSTASVTIFSVCDSRSANHFAAGSSTTPRTLATGATSATHANAKDALRSAFVTPNRFKTTGNAKIWNRISATPPTTSTRPICDALRLKPPKSSRVAAYTGKISSYPMAMNAKTAYDDAAMTVCASHPCCRKRESAVSSSCRENARRPSTKPSTAAVPGSKRVSSSSSSAECVS